MTEPESVDGNELVVHALTANGVSTIYGVVGIPVTDLARTAQARGIRFLGFRNEQAAGHAAAAAGYLTGRPGICLTVSAPGFLNGLVALATATTDCFPMIQISGSSDRSVVDLEQGDYEELDQLAAARPFAKAAYRVDSPDLIGVGVGRAIRAAVSGRPGGVYLDLPAHVLAGSAPPAPRPPIVDAAPRQIPAPAAVERALALLEGAQRPLIVLGKGAAYARADRVVRDFVEATRAPFVPMSMAKGLLPDDHPQSAAAARSLALETADVVVLIGARLNWLLDHGRSPRWAPDAQFVQLDICATEFDSNRPIAAPVLGDIGSSTAALLATLRAGQIKPSRDWLNEISAARRANTAKMEERLHNEVHPMDFAVALRAVRDVLDRHRDTVVVSEGANTLDNARNIIPIHYPRHRLDVGTWGVMGVGLGYAIAAAVETGHRVVAIEGDSAFGFSGMEIETICRYHLPVVVIVFNNGGVYRGDEVNAHSADPAPTALLRSSRYDTLIEAFGGVGYHAETPEEVAVALRSALESAGPALIDCIIDPAVGTESGHLQNLNRSAHEEES
ncbi:oxalyl-CoA decarboxylase [Prescottella agglutinans]|uniref:Oxalyl-CoA decarboxylase n=1 Tax=Prescottella agglutinans TaxID=1644129 RepID=A0ABT6MFK7_9NOCA|nr:oxalyl-CoA decarboxylase [Prescottella agglutinans]MDH6283073.1 oxalyl-CoA decarboxylase [Prescottella agglutinans]